LAISPYPTDTVKNKESSGKALIALGVIGIIACLAAIATSFMM
jgi:hypothetical protein